MKYNVGDTIVTKKKHVCGSNEWTVLRTGIEIKIRCNGCGREVMLFKTKLDKRIVDVKQ